MTQVIQAETFRRWLRRLRDKKAADLIAVRLHRATDGHLGDVCSVGDGVSEMRIRSGPGYRLYFIREGQDIIVLLCGGDKSRQRRDIERAKKMAADRRRQHG